MPSKNLCSATSPVTNSNFFTMPTLPPQRKRSKRQPSLQEAVKQANKNRMKKTARAKKRQKDGWQDTDPNAHKWELKDIPTTTPGARIATITRRASISDVFFTLLPPAVLVEIRKEVGKEQLFYGTEKVPITDIYKMYAATLYLRAAAPTVDKGVYKNIFNLVYKLAINFFDNRECLGICKMIKLRNVFRI